MSVRRAGAQNRTHAKAVGVVTRSMRLLLDTDDQNGNKVASGSDKASSPESTRSSSSLSSIGSSRQSPADVEMLDCCLGKEAVPLTNEGFGPAPFHGSGCGQDEGITRLESDGKPTSLYLDTKPDNWNDNLALAMTGLQDDARRGEGSDRSADASPDCAVSEGGGGDEPAIPSRCGSCDGRVSSASVSSGDTALNSDGVGLSDSGSDGPPSASLLGGSPAPTPAPGDIGTSSIALPDVCEGLRDRTPKAGASGEDGDSQPGGVALFPRPGGEDTYLAIDESPPGPPCEAEAKEGRSTGAAERECSSPAPLCRTYVEAEPLQCSSGACTPVGGGTFLVLGSEDSDTSCGAQTSTPVQGSAENKTFCLPPPSESPCRDNRGNVGSPAARPPKGRPRPPVPPLPAASRPPASAAHRRAKTVPTRFPQPDLKNVKPKVMSRPTTPLRVSNLARVATTPSKPAPANQNAPAGSPAQRKGEAGDGGKRLGTSLNSNKGVAQKSRPRRRSECDSAVRPRRDSLLSSAQRDTANRGGSSASNVTFDTLVPPSEPGRRNTPVQGADTPGGTVRPSEAGPRENGTPAERCAENQEVGSAAAADGADGADGGRGRLGPRPSPGGARGASSSRAPAADQRAPAPAPKPAASSKDGRVSGGMSVSRARHTAAAAGSQKARLTERPSVAPGAKPTLGPGVALPRSAGVSRLPVKSQDHGEPGPATGGTQAASVPANGGKAGPGPPAPRHAGKPPITKTTGGVRVVVQSPQRKALAAGVKNAAVPNQTPSKFTASPLHRAGSGRFQRPATAPPVDRSRQQRASPRTQAPAPTPAPPDLLPADTKPPGAELHRPRADGGAGGKRLQQLKKLLASGNRRFEAVAVVIQHVVTEREEAEKQKRELSQELLTLRGELVTSSASCETLEREKDELRAAFDGVMRKAQEQHQSDLADLEQRLKAFYSAEWEKMHQAYQEEADRCRSQMQQQLDDFKSKHEALRKELEDGHAEKLEGLKQHYEATLEELRTSHQEEMESLDKTLKEAEAKLTEQVQELTAENSALNEKLNAEEERRRILAEKCQKDSHTLYLEQELESLKVVLDIKNKQLHQQDKKLMQMDKLMEKSVKLDECLKKVQQENEDLKARMDRHAALSRQLSTEQAVLQESLQKESKVNKRLSMENEELLWKLHNGDLSSPRKLSPTSPSKTFQSPRNSGVFSSAPVSPR
ncbi:microtubule-associated tumor suppressor 1 homolog A isoform X1 [Anguilla rostrata]|uniref:microtubule-associated tumor suppressor 1 homolog A isoform X1 n=1 Tax=Anguilla rostrata TaxID=7938 RepID=UPI0030D5B479